MAKIAKSITDLIGKTPLVEISNYSKAEGAKVKLLKQRKIQ